MDTGSVWYDILRAVQRTLTTVSPWTDDRCKVRRRLAYIRERDTPLPFLCLSPGVRREGEHQFGGKLFWLYEVRVGLFEESALILEGPGLAEHLARLHGVQQKLHVTSLTVASDVFDVDGFDAAEPFEGGAFDDALDVSVMKVTYKSRETRSS